jgi:hypothetical protein
VAPGLPLRLCEVAEHGLLGFSLGEFGGLVLQGSPSDQDEARPMILGQRAHSGSGHSPGAAGHDDDGLRSQVHRLPGLGGRLDDIQDAARAVGGQPDVEIVPAVEQFVGDRRGVTVATARKLVIGAGAIAVARTLGARCFRIG